MQCANISYGSFGGCQLHLQITPASTDTTPPKLIWRRTAKSWKGIAVLVLVAAGRKSTCVVFAYISFTHASRRLCSLVHAIHKFRRIRPCVIV